MEIEHWEEYPTMLFTKHDDGTVTVDRWLDHILVTPEFLTNTDPAYVQYEEDYFSIKITNGEALYKLIGFDPHLSNVYRAVRVYPEQ